MKALMTLAGLTLVAVGLGCQGKPPPRERELIFIAEGFVQEAEATAKRPAAELCRQRRDCRPDQERRHMMATACLNAAKKVAELGHWPESEAVRERYVKVCKP